MVLANDFSADKKQHDDEPSKGLDSQLQQPYIETDFVRSTIPVSSYGDSGSPAGTPTEDKPPDYSTLTSAGKGLSSVTRVTSDGRLAVSLKFNQALPDLPKDYAAPVDEFAVDPTLSEPSAAAGIRAGGRVPRLNIVAMLVGSHGDVQPHIALGQELSKHGHRIRIATHAAFRENVSQAGLEFFDIGGDPNELMGFMMRNSGLVSGFASLNRGRITRNRRTIKDILDGCWRACIQTATPGELPFTADAIIANPPSFAHVHCAEALGIPVHMTFTMPWSPTTAFPHPLVNISQSNGEPRLTNYLSYALAELMIWQGLGDLINNFRRNTLGLKKLNMRTGAGVLDKLKIPCTYAFSESLVPKPEDWRNHIDVAGFFCQEQDHIYTPSPDLIAFISEGPPPIYVNFGSTPFPDPLALTRTVVESARLLGTRILLAPLSPIPAFPFSSLPSHVFLLPPGVPASALLPYTCAVLHAGEADLTAAVLRAGKPSVAVPCVGGQSFWAWALHRAGAAARPVETALLLGSGKAKDTSKGALVLKEAIEVALSEGIVENAKMIGERIGRENGMVAGVHSFHRHLPLLNMRCDLFPERLAVWWSPKHYLRLSAFAAQILADVGLLDIKDLQIHRSKEYIHDPNFADPISGGVVEVFRSIVDFHTGIAQIFTREPVQGLINTTVALPRGVFYSIDSIQEGFHHTPRLWGSKTRYEKPVKDWKGGLAEGGKALFHGVMDGITGLVTEPIDGYKNEGTIGALKGTGRGVLNAGFRPAAGSLALVTKPVKGAFFSIMSSFTPSTNVLAQLRSARILQGAEQSALASDTEKLEVVKRWQSEVIKARLKERRKDWRKAKEEEKEGWILRSEHMSGGSGGIVGRNYSVDGSSAMTHGGHIHEHGHARTLSGSSAPAGFVDEVGQAARSPVSPPAYEGTQEYPVQKEVAERQRWLELEQSVAEAERRGYQRGLEEAAARDKGKQKPSFP